MMGRELSGRTFPEIGIHDAHHPTSHHQKDPEKIAKLAQINRHYVAQFAYYLERLRATPEGDGSLLDHLTIMYGGGMSDGDSHSPDNLPTAVDGWSRGTAPGRTSPPLSPRTPIANLHVTLLERLGISMDRFGNSHGTAVALGQAAEATA